nr:immunoglobulin light chain junction region [Macaca mulatta]MOY11169.1 immunoglobulin light chain junction region [Macaca mulatta]MOY11570.1 immunoglobulin light chain junction region [Macaca mulatta]MOY11705.1 immunoglobulin light chain junction region [Macaca mulatta]MOY11810.1 immunoglobulin light chain junction region [Macaca mulatta]
CLQTKDFPYTF